MPLSVKLDQVVRAIVVKRDALQAVAVATVKDENTHFLAHVRTEPLETLVLGSELFLITKKSPAKGIGVSRVFRLKSESIRRVFREFGESANTTTPHVVAKLFLILLCGQIMSICIQKHHKMYGCKEPKPVIKFDNGLNV